MSDIPPNDKQEPEKLNFYYNRERRLQRAPKIVRDAWENNHQPPNKGFLKGLTGNPGSRSIFISIIILSALVVGLTFLKGGDNTYSSSELKASLKVFLYGESIYVTLSGELKDSTNSSFVVLFQGLDKDSRIVAYSEQVGVWDNSKLSIRLALTDYDIVKVRALLTLKEQEIMLTATVDRN